MNQLLKPIAKTFNVTDYRPVFYDLKITDQALELSELLQDKEITVFDTIARQILELKKALHPGEKISEEEMQEQLNNQDTDLYGQWVYYPWSKKLLHLLEKEDFIRVRTNRNAYKIAPEELDLLRSKKIGIIGLSVGQSIAQTIATERICGELRLADFDVLELGNLNRLNARIEDIGVPKVVIAARKIAEIDPYIDVKCWDQGLNTANIDEFLTANGKIDILVEECDGLDMKIISRLKARNYGIPVVMDTNDCGMLDVERFDTEPDRQIFHGRTPEIENIPDSQLIERLENLTFQEKVGYLSKIIGFENISDEMKFSLSQMNKTITGWPQLSSAVTLGAALVTDTCRRILLGKFKGSGRFFVQFKELVK